LISVVTTSGSQVALAHLNEGAGQRRHHAGQRHARYVIPRKTTKIEQVAQKHGVFVRHFFSIRGHAPVGDPFIVAVQSQLGVGVVDVHD
jgi:hypothetical protein